MKQSKPSVGYVYSPGTDYFCKECAYITKQGECSAYTPKDAKVKPFGGCNLWDDLQKGRMEGNHSHTREETAYMENQVGFSCKRCEYFNTQAYLCKEVSEVGPPLPGMISPNGCCNLWKKDAIRGDKTHEQLFQIMYPPTPESKLARLNGLFRRMLK